MLPDTVCVAVTESVPGVVVVRDLDSSIVNDAAVRVTVIDLLSERDAVPLTSVDRDQLVEAVCAWVGLTDAERSLVRVGVGGGVYVNVSVSSLVLVVDGDRDAVDDTDRWLLAERDLLA